MDKHRYSHCISNRWPIIEETVTGFLHYVSSEGPTPRKTYQAWNDWHLRALDDESHQESSAFDCYTEMCHSQFNQATSVVSYNQRKGKGTFTERVERKPLRDSQ